MDNDDRSDEYPDDEQILAIQKWQPMGQWSGSRPWLPILQLMSDAWNHDMGRVKQDGDVWTFCTGGWSGNEEIIGAIHKNFSAHSMLWIASFRGGKFVYGVDDD
jgi:hypothetical protein